MPDQSPENDSDAEADHSAIQLVVLDWNGTLLNDADVGLAAYNSIRVEYGMPLLTLEEMRRYYTVPIRDSWIAAGFDGATWDRDQARIKDMFHDSYEVGANRCQAYPGAMELLSWLHANQIESMVLSNHLVDDIRKQLARLGVDPLADVILANTDRAQTGVSRTKGARLRERLEKESISAGAVIVVGDTNEEIEIARDLGAYSAVVTQGWESEERLRAAEPDYMITSLAELIGIIQELNGVSRS